jgi:uncharacterized membrane protein
MTARALLTSVAAIAVTLAATTAAAQPPMTSVRQAGGEYMVSATFTVPGPARVAREVLTDYPNIPRFMPDVRSSVVVEHRDGFSRVRQEAVPQFMWFSKEISLLLDVDEGAEVLRFRDRGNTSFARYDGSWTMTARGDQTELTYQLTARPAFSVPGFVLRKLLKRDAVAMIDRLRSEIAARAIDE